MTLAGILRRLAALLAAIVVCATVAGFWREGACLAVAAVDAAASAGATRGGERVRVVGGDHDAPRPELAAAVFDDEQGEDDDLRPDGANGVASAVSPLAAQRDAGRAWRDDPSIAISRSVVATALPRGPPARQA